MGYLSNTPGGGGPGSDPSIGGPIIGGTTGSVLFVGAAALIAQDNANFFWDNTNNRLGIGMNTPATPLVVTKPAGVNEVANIQIATPGVLDQQQSAIDFITLSDGSFLGTPTNKGWTFYARGNAFITAGERNDFGLAFWNGLTYITPWHMDSLTGNMGINVTNPTTVLDIAGTATNAAIQFGAGQSAAVSSASTGRIRYNATTQVFQVSQNGAAYVDLAAGSAVAGAGAAGQATFWTGGANISGDDQFYWNDTDKTFSLGDPSNLLGLLTFQNKFSLRIDDVNSAGTVLVTQLIEASGTKTPYLVFAKSNGDLVTKTIVSAGDMTLNLASLGYDGTGYLQTSGISSVVEGVPGAGSIDSNLIFKTSLAGTLVDAMYMAPDGRIAFGATTVPVGVRMYTNTVGGNSQVYFESPDDTANQIAFLRGSGLSYFGPSSTNEFHIYGGVTSAVVSVPIVIHPGTSETARFVNDINRSMEFVGGQLATVLVARSTTADVVGSNLVVKAGGATVAGTDRAGGNLVLNSGISTGSAESVIEFYTATPAGTGTADNTPTLKITLDGDGNLGIGTATPSSLLHVNGSQSVKRTAAGVTGNIALTDYYVGATANNITLTLPTIATAGVGKMYVVKDESGTASGGNPITIDGNGAETIDGAANFPLVTAYQSVTLLCNGTEWSVI